MEIIRLKKRADFLLVAASGIKFIKPSVIVQIKKRSDDTELIRVGFTATKKLGGAVIRNRIKRQMRAIFANLGNDYAAPGCDYVLIGRNAIKTTNYQEITREIKHSLKRLADMVN